LTYFVSVGSHPTTPLLPSISSSGIRLNDEADEKTFTSFLEEFVKPEPEGKSTCFFSFFCGLWFCSPLLTFNSLIRNWGAKGREEGKERGSSRAQALLACSQPGANEAHPWSEARCQNESHGHLHPKPALAYLQAPIVAGIGCLFWKGRGKVGHSGLPFSCDDANKLQCYSIPHGVFDAINAMDFQTFPLLSNQEKRLIRAADDEKRSVSRRLPQTKKNKQNQPSRLSDISRPRLCTQGSIFPWRCPLECIPMKLEMYGYTVIVAVNAFLDFFLFLLSFFLFFLFPVETSFLSSR